MSIRLSQVDQSKCEKGFIMDKASEIAGWQDLFSRQTARPILIGFANCPARPERVACVATRPLTTGFRLAPRRCVVERTTPFVAVEILCREQKKAICSMIPLIHLSALPNRRLLAKRNF